MDQAKLGNFLELIIIACLIGDLALMWKMAYGTYPWEQGGKTS